MPPVCDLHRCTPLFGGAQLAHGLSDPSWGHLQSGQSAPKVVATGLRRPLWHRLFHPLLPGNTARRTLLRLARQLAGAPYRLPVDAPHRIRPRLLAGFLRITAFSYFIVVKLQAWGSRPDTVGVGPPLPAARRHRARSRAVVELGWVVVQKSIWRRLYHLPLEITLF